MLIKSSKDLFKLLQFYRNDFHVEKIGMSELENWEFYNGALAHKSKGFFSFIAIENDYDSENIYLYQPQQGITGLLTKVIDNDRYFLLQARAEPGHPNGIQIGPTVQSTPANHLKLHGGTTTRYIEYFIHPNMNTQIVVESTHHDLGNRYLFKDKRLIVLECFDEPTVDSNYFWISQKILAKTLNMDFLYNVDVRALLSVMPWNSTFLNKEEFPVVSYFESALSLSFKSNFSNLQIKSNINLKKYKIRDVQKLSNWVWNEFGCFELIPRHRLSIEYYKISATGREVRQWTQPLMNCQTNGHVVQFVRIKNNRIELLLSMDEEFGVSSNSLLLPTFVSYPGDVESKFIEFSSKYLDRNINFLCQVKITDEGGRFYQNNSNYSVVLKDIELNEDSKRMDWIDISDTKNYINQSNLPSIQLRTIFSLLLSIDVFNAIKKIKSI